MNQLVRREEGDEYFKNAKEEQEAILRVNKSLAERKEHSPEIHPRYGQLQEFMKKYESSGEYDKENDEGMVGAYQFSPQRLDDWFNSVNSLPPGKFNKAGKGMLSVSKETFKNDPELQDRAFRWHISDIQKYIDKHKLQRYIGKKINGVEVTTNGLIGVAHLGGKRGMRTFLENDGKNDSDKVDKYGTRLTDYLRKLSSKITGGSEIFKLLKPKDDFELN